jgi:hypothetical protein
VTLPVDEPLARFLDALARRGAHGRTVREAIARSDLEALAGALAARDALAPELAAAAASLASAPGPARAAALVAAAEAEADDAVLEARVAAARDETARDLAHLDHGEAAADAYQGGALPRLDIVR